MIWLRKIQSRLGSLFHKQRLEAEIDEELQSHLELRALQNEKEGMSPEEARLAAKRQFGWSASIRESCREQRGLAWAEALTAAPSANAAVELRWRQNLRQ